ncbi:hypothetical protein [Clostridium sp. Cult2]|uniref:hypothetical protein n=1 Tax=Clostridium sp. Cult2 TaxID=2079003 RepID=UPI001F329126|nr:hypothetical protein [Clostridium sp. Cult2]MCF6464769.1 hypothetical protein [Clostridium sp. Cult2]
MDRKIAKLILLVIFFTVFSPIVSEGVGYVKEIDGDFYGLYMEVEGKKIISNKQPFIYDDEIWVPLWDLAKGLNLSIEIDKVNKIANLDSKGRLKSDSKDIQSFQRGYEIEAKGRIIDGLENEIYLLEKGKEREQASLKNKTTKNIKVYFGDVKVYLDNEKLSFSKEPFFFNDDIYVPIMDIGSYLYITPTLDKKYNKILIDANGILVSKDYPSNLDNLVSIRNGRNHLLDIEIENLEKRKELYKSLNIPYRNISNVKTLENHLNRYMDKVGSLIMDIEIKKSSGNWLDITFSFPSSKVYNWYRLNRKEVEDYIWDIYSAILILYNEDALIKGSVRNPYYSKYSSSSYRDYVKFQSKGKDLSFDFSRSNLKKDYRIDSNYFEDILNKNLNKYNNVEFKYSATQRGDTVDLDIMVNSKNFFNWSIYTKLGYLKRLNYEIRRINPDLYIDGNITYTEDYDKNIRFNIHDNRIISVDLLNETEDYINSMYSSFSYGRYIFGLKYSIYEKDIDELGLVVEGNFSIYDDSWIYAGSSGLDRLNARVESAVNYITSLWDRDVFVKINLGQ